MNSGNNMDVANPSFVNVLRDRCRVTIATELLFSIRIGSEEEKSFEEGCRFTGL